MKNKKLIPLLFCLCVSTLSAKEFTLSKQTDLSILISGTLLAGFDFASEHFWNLKDTTYNQALVDIDLVPEIDKLFINHYSKTLDYSATATLALGFLTPAVLLPADKSEWFTIGTMYAETVLWAYGVKEFAKLVVTRARP